MQISYFRFNRVRMFFFFSYVDVSPINMLRTIKSCDIKFSKVKVCSSYFYYRYQPTFSYIVSQDSLIILFPVPKSPKSGVFLPQICIFTLTPNPHKPGKAKTESSIVSPKYVPLAADLCINHRQVCRNETHNSH